MSRAMIPSWAQERRMAVLKQQRRKRRIRRWLVEAVVALLVATMLAGTALLIFVAVHFILKWW